MKEANPLLPKFLPLLLAGALLSQSFCARKDKEDPMPIILTGFALAYPLLSRLNHGACPANIDLGISANPGVNANTSHERQITGLHVVRQNLPTQIFGAPRIHAVAYADFDQDGDTDIFTSALYGTNQVVPAELFLNDGAENFSVDASFFNGAPPGQVHPRKALAGDFNGDGKMDAFSIGHGYDVPPYSGEAPYAVLSGPSGFVLAPGLDGIIGFHHGGAAADIDADGDLDVFITSNKKPFFLINDGAGNFTYDASRLGALDNYDMFTAELLDINGDGFVDILTSGHEFGIVSFPSLILWGDSTGVYCPSKSTLIPPVGEFRTIVDMDARDLNGDGLMDLVLTRTGSPETQESNYYRGYSLQILLGRGNKTFEDVTASAIPEGMSITENWIDWIRLQDYNSDSIPDIVIDDRAYNYYWRNDGAGNFTKTAIP